MTATTPDSAGRHGAITLTNDEMAMLERYLELKPDNCWWEPGDTVDLHCYCPDDSDPNPSIVMTIDDTQHDNWLTWGELPAQLRRRLRAEAATGKKAPLDIMYVRYGTI